MTRQLTDISPCMYQTTGSRLLWGRGVPCRVASTDSLRILKRIDVSIRCKLTAFVESLLALCVCVCVCVRWGDDVQFLHPFISNRNASWPPGAVRGIVVAAALRLNEQCQNVCYLLKVNTSHVVILKNCWSISLVLTRTCTRTLVLVLVLVHRQLLHMHVLHGR